MESEAWFFQVLGTTRGGASHGTRVAGVKEVMDKEAWGVVGG